MQPTTRSGLLSDACCSLLQMHATCINNMKMMFEDHYGTICCLYFRSLVSIQGPEGYGPSTLPLRHSELVIP